MIFEGLLGLEALALGDPSSRTRVVLVHPIMNNVAPWNGVLLEQLIPTLISDERTAERPHALRVVAIGIFQVALWIERTFQQAARSCKRRFHHAELLLNVGQV